MKQPEEASNSKVRLSLVVMHAAWNTSRRVHLQNLMRSLGGLREIRAETVYFHVERDVDRSGLWPTARKAWKRGLYTDCTHHLVIQDDVLACRNFLKAAKILAELKP